MMLCAEVFYEKKHIDFDEYWEICDEWYLKNTDISKDEFRSFPFHNGFNTGDIMILKGRAPEDLKIGDIIVYQTNRPDPIIHRIVNIWAEEEEYFFQTKGDHNPSSNGDEHKIAEDQIIGEAIIRVPYLGWVKIWFVNLIQVIGKL
jgi:signal peptidase I